MAFCWCESSTNLCNTQEDREALSHLAYLKIMTARVRKQSFYFLIYLFIFCLPLSKWLTNRNTYRVVQGEHKNTSSFQIVIKSKLTGIFL